MRLSTGVTLVGLFALGIGCAPVVPIENPARAKAAVQAAEQMGAEQHPRAAMHLRMARDELRAAESIAREGDGPAANLLVRRAETDADLAIALTREAGLRAEAAEVRARAQQFRGGAVP